LSANFGQLVIHFLSCKEFRPWFKLTNTIPEPLWPSLRSVYCLVWTSLCPGNKVGGIWKRLL